MTQCTANTHSRLLGRTVSPHMAFVDTASCLADQDQSSTERGTPCCGSPLDAGAAVIGSAGVSFSLVQKERTRGSETARELWSSWQNKSSWTGPFLLGRFFSLLVMGCSDYCQRVAGHPYLFTLWCYCSFLTCFLL